MADKDVVLMTWGETCNLSAKDGSPETLKRLYAVIAKFAAAAKAAKQQGAFRKAPAPRLDAPTEVAAYTAVEAMVTNVENAQWTADPPLPKRAALLEVDSGGKLLFPDKATSWALAAGVTKGGIFQTGEESNRRFFQLFESQTEPPPGEFAYLSGLNRARIPSGVAVGRWYKNPNWWIGLAGGFVFFLALFSILWTANSFSQAYDLLAGRQVGQLQAFAKAFPAKCDECLTPGDRVEVDGKPLEGEARQKALQAALNKKGPECIARLEKWGNDLKTPRAAEDQAPDLACLRIMGEAMAFASGNLVVQANNWVGAVLQWIGRLLFSWHVPPPTMPTVSLGSPMFLMMAATVVVLVALGRGVTGRPLGALISPEGRYSLALAQVTFWTVLVLTSAGALAVFNAGLVSEHLRDLPRSDVEAIAIFPSIPPEIWAVLGISFVSPVLSTLIKGLKPDAADGSEITVSSGGPASVTFLTSKTSGIVQSDARRASIADWFLGEEGANKDRIDISRVQMVLVTAGLLVTYGSEIFAFTRDITPARMVAVIAKPSALFATLPPVGATMAALLLMSHATYLIAKASDKVPQK
jgi:hypothetical protein